MQTAELIAVTSGDYSESALAALREEGIRLREINVSLREEELAARAQYRERTRKATALPRPRANGSDISGHPSLASASEAARQAAQAA